MQGLQEQIIDYEFFMAVKIKDFLDLRSNLTV